MKPKIILAKYLDWAVLAILGVVLIIVAIKSFPLRAAGEQKLKDEISQYDQAVQRGMSDTSAQPLPLHDYLSEIRNRLEHPAVLDPYRRNPFLTREDIPYPPLQLRVGIPHTVRFVGTRFTRVIAGDEKLLHVDLAYDLPTGVSTVTFIPLATGETSVRIQTDDDLVHLFKISVRTLITPPPPNPPTNVAVIPRAAVQFRRHFQAGDGAHLVHAHQSRADQPDGRLQHQRRLLPQTGRRLRRGVRPPRRPGRSARSAQPRPDP